MLVFLKDAEVLSVFESLEGRVYEEDVDDKGRAGRGHMHDQPRLT